MQSVSAAFTAEERDSTRGIAHSLLASWKKENSTSSRTFTIGVSEIGGEDLIGLSGIGGIGNPGDYVYTDESDYVMSMGWERELNMPVGGLSRAFADAELDNTSGRFLPSYMGGSSELFTAILPRRPVILNAGFYVSGVAEQVPVMSGLFKRQPQVDVRSRQVNIDAEDYVGFFESKYVDETSLYTGITTDVLLETIFNESGMTTAQYEIDAGLNTIPFTIIESGAKFSDIINELAIAENGHVFQDEEGIFHFWNRLHFDSGVFTSVQRTIFPHQVLNAESPNEDHIINVVEVSGDIYEKRSTQQIFSLTEAIPISAGVPKEVFASLEDPVLEVTGQTIAGAVNADGSGGSITVNVASRSVFAQAVKYVLTSSSTGFVTQLDINGRSAVSNENLYVRKVDDSSLTAYEERPLTINNRYIQDRSWADSLSQLILNSYSEPDNLQKITIRAMPELQLGDLVSYLNFDWRIYGIRANLDPGGGFTQELIMLKDVASETSYFQIGISSIGGTHVISP